MNKRITILIALAVVLLLSMGAAASAAGSNRAGLVIRWGGNRVSTYVVQFQEESISGADLLQRALGDRVELDWQAGGIVAAINNIGCHPPVEGAFCQCQGGGVCTYWRYYHLSGGKWAYSNQGATSYRVHDGDVEGWAWASSDAPPPVYTIGQLTAPPTPTTRPVTSTPKPTRPPRPSATPTLAPLITPTTVPTAISSIAPTISTPAPSPATATPTTSASSETATPTDALAATVTPTLEPLISNNLATATATTTESTSSEPSTPAEQLPSPTTTPSNMVLPMLAILPFMVMAALAWGQRRKGGGHSLDSRTWLVWLVAAMLFVSNNPYFLVMLLLVCVSVYFACAPTGGAVSGGLLLRFGLIVTFFVTLFNFLTAHYGLTVLARLPLDWPLIGGVLTLEGLVSGLLRGLSLLTLLAIFAVFNRVVDHYELLKLTPRPLYRIGLATSIAVAFVPQTLAAIREVATAQELRGYKVRVRDMLPLFAPILTLGLEKAVQLAEALETRAWGNTAAPRTCYRHLNLRRTDYLVIASAALAAALALLARLFGLLPDYYPYPQLSAPTFTLAGLSMILLLAPAVLVLTRQPAKVAKTKESAAQYPLAQK